MIFLQYLGIALLTVLGLFIGVFIAKNTEEELKDGLKYFKFLMLIVSFIVFFLFTRVFLNDYFAGLISLVIVAASIFLMPAIRDPLSFGLLAISFSIIKLEQSNYVVPSLIFLYFLAYGSIVYYLNRKHLKKELGIKSIVFVIIALVLFFF